MIVTGQQYSGEVMRVDFGYDIPESEDQDMFIVDNEGTLLKVQEVKISEETN